MTANNHTQYSARPVSPLLDPATPVVRRLGQRLNHLYQWAVAEAYDHIWDLCCDHGRLGLHLHQTLQASLKTSRCCIHLIDCVPSVINILKARYAPLLCRNLTIQCLDAGDIVLPSEGRQMVVLAGIGSGTMTTILKKILHQIDVLERQNSEVNVEFMLSPNLNAFELRSFLRQQSLELIKEEFVTDKGQHHEHLHLRYRADVDQSAKVAPVGLSLWFPLTEEKVRYLKKSLIHYQNCVQLGGDTSAQGAVDAYSDILKEAGFLWPV